MEAVITGKEVAPYTLKTAENFLLYDRKNFQQAAPEKYYRAPEKLVYKFISNQLVFSYDNTGTLVLNSANILIPEIPGMSIKTVLAFLNSDFLRYYYQMLSNDIKILKSHLMQLPFPEIPPADSAAIDAVIDKILAGDNTCIPELQNKIYRCYQLSQDQISYIENFLLKKPCI